MIVQEPVFQIDVAVSHNSLNAINGCANTVTCHLDRGLERTNQNMRSPPGSQFKLQAVSLGVKQTRVCLGRSLERTLSSRPSRWIYSEKTVAGYYVFNIWGRRNTCVDVQPQAFDKLSF